LKLPERFPLVAAQRDGFWKSHADRQDALILHDQSLQSARPESGSSLRVPKTRPPEGVFTLPEEPEQKKGVAIYDSTSSIFMKPKFLAAFACLSIATLAAAANVPPIRTNPKPGIIFNAEKSYIDSRIGVLENEMLNNDEEEFILLASSDAYFTGFDDGMTDAIAELSGFNYTGNPAVDFAAISSSLLAEQDAADALGTPYGTGEGTAYQYALVVLNSNLDPTTIGSTAGPEAKAALPDTKAVEITARPASAQVRSQASRELP
jgi:hypothetical protein